MPPRKTREKEQSSQPDADLIRIRGARVHNLKNVSLDLPRNSFIVFTGVSGSGKSSLAFDTIYAEGQRRYVESLSSYARQFLERMEKPDLDSIHGIGPAVAIEQKANTRNPRSTVGTSTEVYDYLRLLFARVGRTHCRKCGKEVSRDSVQTVLRFLEGFSAQRNNGTNGQTRIYVGFPLPVHEREPLAESLENLKKEGFVRLLAGGSVIDLDREQVPAGIASSDIMVLVDRLVFRPGDDQSRISDSLETSFVSGGGEAMVVLVDENETRRFNRRFECAECGLSYEEPDARLFSFNNPYGACPECQGFGQAIGIDMALVVPDRSKTLRSGAIQPWNTPKFSGVLQDLLSVGREAGVRLDVPFRELTEQELDAVMDGFGDFEGIRGFFARVEKKSYKIYYRVLLSRYRGYSTCSLCSGSRLRREALNVRVGGKRISDIVGMTIHDALEFFRELQLMPSETQIADRVLTEIRKRLGYLDDVGIGYLSLDRLSRTLSGGESQRINLATSLGSTLVGSVYVLDEPSIGLHPRDTGKLIGILKALRDGGNTVMVVEHDREVILSGDIVVDLGPGAGKQGGSIVAVSPPGELIRNPESITGRYLARTDDIPLPKVRRAGNGKAIVIRGADHHNLKGIDVAIPLGKLVCITGVSGSGKSTLLYDILYEGLRRGNGTPGAFEPFCKSIEGGNFVDSVECVDQSPIGRSPRSNPVTYIQVFDQIRDLFARTQSARIHGFRPGTFSFNVPGGRCEACEGDGVIKVEMQFMADLFLTCEVCKGKRYKQEVLGVRWNGLNIDDVLSMTVTEAIRFFSQKPDGLKVARRMSVLENVGLGYIQLGQPATSLSGGEAQRVKLAAHLASAGKLRTLFLFDEPTTGLHFDDIARLMRCFDALIEAGDSVVIIEHNMDVIKCADHVIDLGPEAGEAGGRIVAVGTPEEIAGVELSHTGQYLRDYVGNRKPAAAHR
jgi:excinuclease ABC subunit A